MKRSATVSDLAELTRLSDTYDTRWFGAPESDADEVREGFEHITSPTTDSIVIENAGRLDAAAWWFGTAAVLSVDATIDTAPVYDELLAWVETRDRPLAVSCLSRDAVLLSTLGRRGWSYHHSSFELIRELTPDWALPPPELPRALRLSALQQLPVVHDLIYRRAGWASVIGHGERDLEEWQRLFLPDAVRPEEQIVVWDGADPVGVALGRIYGDGTGWISQLAVAREHRGRGIGRALLLTMLSRHVAGGATRLGLQVSATNRGALAIYLDVGLTIDREWREFVITG